MRAAAVACSGCLLVLLATPASRADVPPPEEVPDLPVDVTLPPSPHPSVQWTFTLELGGGGALRESAPRETEGIFHIAAHSLVLFGRHKANYWGVGLCLDVATWDGKTLMAGGGFALLIPFAGFLPLVIEAWPHYHWEKDDAAAMTFRIWWGVHGRNYIKSHTTVLGIYVQATRGWGTWEAERWTIVAGVDLSMIIPLLPFIAVGNLIYNRGASQEGTGFDSIR